MPARARILLCVLGLLTAAGIAQNSATSNTPQATITHGPVIESATATSVVIAWTTNVSAGTLVKYGSDAGHLSRSTGMPWGGYTHRATLRNLQPDTTYYFQATSPHAQGSGETLTSSVAEVHTLAAQP